MANLLKDLITGDKDPESVLTERLKEVISPVTDRVDSVEETLKELIETVKRLESLLQSLQPLANLINKIPFLK